MEQNNNPLTPPKKLSPGRIAVLVISLAVMIGVTIFIIIKLLPMLGTSQAAYDARLAFSEKVKAWGAWAYLVMFLLQVVQVVFAAIPGEPIEWLMGSMFGAVPGALVCLAGSIVGTIAIFGIVRGLGKAGAAPFVDEKKLDKYVFLKNTKNRDAMLFFIFLMPGTPKDVITYFVPFLDIKLWKFLLIAHIARIPAIVSSTYAGSLLIKGQFRGALIAMAVIFVVALLGIAINAYFMAKMQKRLAQPAPDQAENDE